MSLAFDYPTVEAIANYLAKDILKLDAATVQTGEFPPGDELRIDQVGETHVLEKIEELTDEDVDRLLDQMKKGSK